MRPALVHTAAWLAATGAAGALTWFGVHTALSGTAYDPPRALTVPQDARTGGARTGDGDAVPPTPSPSPSRTAAGPSRPAAPSGSPSGAPPASASPSRAAAAESAAPPSSAPPAAPGQVESRTVPGGRVALDLLPASAELVSATPEPGWRMQVWDQPEWIRVDFSRDDRTSSVFVTWNGHPPTVQTVEG